MIEVRKAGVGDVPRIAEVMARAYIEDPLMVWVVPAHRRLDRMRRFFRTSIHVMVARSLRDIYTTADLAGEATWAEPGDFAVRTSAMIPAVPSIVAALGARGFARVTRAYALLKRHHPRSPHWYLEGLATDPDRQKSGVATALVRPVLERCDRERVPAYLETQNPSNVPFYEHRGFEVIGRVDLPGGGPRMWLMWREPQG